MAVTATVRSNAEVLTHANLVGKTVAQIRRDFASVINIPDNAFPSIDGVEVSETDVLSAGSTLVFTLPTGSKG